MDDSSDDFKCGSEPVTTTANPNPGEVGMYALNLGYISLSIWEMSVLQFPAAKDLNFLFQPSYKQLPIK